MERRLFTPIAVVIVLSASVLLAGCSAQAAATAGSSPGAIPSAAGSPTPGSSASGSSVPASSAPASSASATTGIRGKATAGPVCPVERVPPESACAPRPVVGAVLVVRDAAGNEVARATTGTDGRYA